MRGAWPLSARAPGSSMAAMGAPQAAGSRIVGGRGLRLWRTVWRGSPLAPFGDRGVAGSRSPRRPSFAAPVSIARRAKAGSSVCTPQLPAAPSAKTAAQRSARALPAPRPFKPECEGPEPRRPPPFPRPRPLAALTLSLSAAGSLGAAGQRHRSGSRQTGTENAVLRGCDICDDGPDRGPGALCVTPADC